MIWKPFDENPFNAARVRYVTTTIQRIMRENKLKDVSHFTRWINGLDEKDKALNPFRRKSKWIVIIAFLFALFGSSFMGFHRSRVKQYKIGFPQAGPLITPSSPAGRSVFEMPVDSFEQQLKQNFHEAVPEKK